MVKAVSTAGGASRVSPVKTTQRTTATNSSAINKVPTSGTLSTHESAKAAHESVAKTSTGSTATIAATASTVIKIPTASVPGSGPTKVKAHMERGAGTGADVSTSIKDTKHPQDMLTPTKGLASNTKASPGTTAVGRNTSKSTGGTSESTVSGVTTTGGTSTHSEAPANGHKSGASVGVTGGVPSIRTHYSSKSNSASRKNRDKDKHKDGKSKGDKHSSSGRKDKDKSRDKDKDGEEAPVVVPTPKPILYADDFADIQQGGLLQHENDLVMLVPTIPAMRVLRQRKAVPARKWIQAPIINHGRKDALKLSHWVPESLRENEHAFAPLGDMVMTDVPVYTDEEYTTHIQPRSGDWTRAETDELLELCRRFDRRFIIVHDRYMGGTGLTSPPVERTIEALKERYYLICAVLAAARAEKDIEAAVGSLPYNAKYELERKSQLQVLFKRTEYEVLEEEFVVPEMKRIQVKLKREKDRIAQKEMASAAISESAAVVSTPAATNMSRKRSSDGSEQKRIKKIKESKTDEKKTKAERTASTTDAKEDPKGSATERSTLLTATTTPGIATKKSTPHARVRKESTPAVTPASTSAADKASTGTGTLERTHSAVSLDSVSGDKTTRKGSSGVFLRSTKMFVPHPASASMKKLHTTYDELGVNLELLSPFASVFTSTEKLRAQVLELIDANKGLKKIEQEKKQADALLEKWKAAKT